MEKEFVDYSIALALKELGFDEPCLGLFSIIEHDDIEIGDFYFGPSYATRATEGRSILAPTFSQAFRWFRENHGLWVTFEYGDCDCEEEDDDCKDCDVCWYIGKCFEYGIGPLFFHELNDFKTLEEAELECLKKLISIVKEKK